MASKKRKRNKKGQFVGGPRIPLAYAASAWRPRKRNRKNPYSSVGLDLAYGHAARALGVPPRGWKPSKAKPVRGNRPGRFVLTGKTGFVSKTGSLTTARDDKARAQRYGLKGVKIHDTKKGVTVRGTTPTKKPRSKGIFG